ncbi:type II toxin-antitoxin system VapC family toxin [Acidicapsa acidisoli]|uniref:type II toxin-antitoxin system VapC family toxin n=1 Tax=Acidicapsa acidisoli TaxID=1615681 RepID=UPI0021DFFF6C|nr:type II toxin-antitoxin system VapC family toxin [Acidicapsa acidisoli]
MRFLLDTHTLIWAVYNQDSLSTHVRQTLELSDHEMIVSAASAWEIATKHRLGKLPTARILAEDFVSVVTQSGYTLLAISPEHALRAGRLPGNHKDPFDRMLAAQAIHEDLTLLSNDADLDTFGVRREW